MKYIIMCGGNYTFWDKPKHLTKIGDECIVERTIRLLRESGVTDIAISANSPLFDDFGVEVLKFENNCTLSNEGYTGHWLNGFYETDKPVCYLFGDVIFSPKAIKTIVRTETHDIEFFASAPPFSPLYGKPYAEPMGFKVVNTKHFRAAIRDALSWCGWNREPVSWELWQVIKGTTRNVINYHNYTAIRDYSCDIDKPSDVDKMKNLVDMIKGEKIPPKYMIHTCPKRKWYVDEYLIPSLIEQGIDKVNIIVYNDSKGEGNLKSCIKAFGQVDDNYGGTWHLQDDVVICKDFKERTEENQYGIVCGFSTERYNGHKPAGWVSLKDMWYSFPCIRIPNKTALRCSEWVSKYMIGNPCYKAFWKDGFNDDWCFNAYLKTVEPDIPILNLAPNLVDHIDYLIGGGTLKPRSFDVRSQYWEDEDVVDDLAKRLSERK